MIFVITGGSGSGKSAFAEKCVQHLEAEKSYYLATMQVTGGEAKEKVERHRRMRADKGFLTIESPRDIGRFFQYQESAVVLLEDMGNLVANEMFGQEEIVEEQIVIEKVCRDVWQLYERVEHLVVVTNEIFSDGVEYAPETMAYLRALGGVNRQLSQMADRVYEVVVGIPLTRKKEK